MWGICWDSTWQFVHGALVAKPVQNGGSLLKGHGCVQPPNCVLKPQSFSLEVFPSLALEGKESMPLPAGRRALFPTPLSALSNLLACTHLALLRTCRRMLHGHCCFSCLDDVGNTLLRHILPSRWERQMEEARGESSLEPSRRLI